MAKRKVVKDDKFSLWRRRWPGSRLAAAVAVLLGRRTRRERHVARHALRADDEYRRDAVTSMREGSDEVPLAYVLPLALAGAAFRAMLAGERDRAARLLGRIANECDGTGMQVAMLSWIDTYAEHMSDGQALRARIRAGRSKMWDRATGEMTGADDERVPACVRWAADMIEARLAMDDVRWDELLLAMPDDGFEAGKYVIALLDCCALTVAHLPRGAGMMGGTQQ